MRNEIGSYFTLENEYLINNKKSLTWFPNHYDKAFTYSGRAAIELAIKDIQSFTEINNVYMPSYCCQSMVRPFQDAGISIDFYDVYYTNKHGLEYNIDPKKDFDVFFSMSYFGLNSNIMDNFDKEIGDDCIVIEDITHRLLSFENSSLNADYTIASIRKWFGIPSGGLITKKDGLLIGKPKNDSSDLVKNTIEGMNEKKEYLSGENIEKSKFLGKLKKSDQTFNEVNATYKIDRISMDILRSLDYKFIREKRKQNAIFLYDQLEMIEGIELLVKDPDWNNDVPLFVPIIVDNNRDMLHKYLIDHGVFCPIHWPGSEKRTNITSNSISLVCDQRYSIKDMQYIVSLIKQWFKGNQR